MRVANVSFVQTNETAPAFRQRPQIADGTQIYRIDPQARIAMIRQGIPASKVSRLDTHAAVFAVPLHCGACARAHPRRVI